MKLLFSFAAIVLFSSMSAAAEAPLTRMFKMDFNGANASDSDTQQCDDTLYTYAELMIPSMRGINVQSVLDQCPAMKPVRMERVVAGNALYTRVKLKGEWNCEYVIERPRRKETESRQKYTVRLSDGC